MVTVHRQHGMRVVIFTDDHMPAHVHVYGSGEAKIDLQGEGDTPTLEWAIGMTRAELRRAMQMVTDNRGSLIARWKEIHG
jgi:hypothetical protein